jgi:hypothetical protein
MKNTIISRFSNIKSKIPENVILWDWLNDTTYKNSVLRIRTLTEKEEIRKLKSQLPCVTISGQFMLRNSNALIKHSGYICIDIDGGDNLHLNDFCKVRDELIKIKNIAYAALSVSGKGVFCLIPIKYPEKHKEHFEALKIQFLKIGITIDKACSDVSRLRIYSFDSDAYFNESPVTFNQVFEYKPVKKNESKKAFEESKPNLKKTYLNGNTTHSRVMKVADKVSNSGVDMTENYEQWFQIGCALANEFGEDGREMFHLVSQNHSGYQEVYCNTIFSDCLGGGYSYSIGTFFYWASQYGIE